MTAPGKKQNRALYICYFGVREPLVQTQVIPYLREIAKQETVHLLTFEPQASTVWTRDEIESERQFLAENNIDWQFLPYHKRFPIVATAYDVIRGAIFASRYLRKGKANVLHARAHIPLAMALLAQKLGKARLIFDIRGLMAEEYVDAGIWSENSIPFKLIKRVERLGLKRADEVVVLTDKLRDHLIETGLRNEKTITVIPCCVDYSRLSSTTGGKRERFELIYAGSVTGLYMLEEMGRLFVQLKSIRTDAFFRVLTAGDQEYVRTVFSGIGINEADYSVQKVDPADVLNLVARSDVAISFRKPTFSQIAASPTKVAEYLACGIPVICNSGIGDITEQIKGTGTGVVIDNFESASYLAAVKELLEMKKRSNLPEVCRSAAKERFDLQTVGGPRYRGLYKRLLDSE